MTRSGKIIKLAELIVILAFFVFVISMVLDYNPVKIGAKINIENASAELYCDFASVTPEE